MDFGSTVTDIICKNNLNGVKVETFGYDDCFVEHGTVEELEKKYKLDAQGIMQKIKKTLF